MRTSNHVAVRLVTIFGSRVMCLMDSGLINAEGKNFMVYASSPALHATQSNRTTQTRPRKLSASASHSSGSTTLILNIPTATVTSTERPKHTSNAVHGKNPIPFYKPMIIWIQPRATLWKYPIHTWSIRKASTPTRRSSTLNLIRLRYHSLRAFTSWQLMT